MNNTLCTCNLIIGILIWRHAVFFVPLYLLEPLTTLKPIMQECYEIVIYCKNVPLLIQAKSLEIVLNGMEYIYLSIEKIHSFRNSIFCFYFSPLYSSLLLFTCITYHGRVEGLNTIRNICINYVLGHVLLRTRALPHSSYISIVLKLYNILYII